VGQEGEGKICLDTMDSFLCHTQECRRFKSDWSIQIKHLTSAFQPYKSVYWFVYDGSNTSKYGYKTSLGS